MVRGLRRAKGSAEEAGLLTKRKQEVLGPGGPGVRESWREGEELPDLEEGDWDFSVCTVSLFLPGGGLCGGVAGGGLGDSGSSFLKFGTRSKPFP